MSTSGRSVWASPFMRSADEVRRLARIAPPPLVGLAGLPPLIAADRIDTAMREVFEPTDQTTALLMEILELAAGHAHRNSPDVAAYDRGVYERGPPLGKHGGLQMLTGLAGGGKSALVAALARILIDRRGVVVAGGGATPLVGYWSLRIGERTSIASVFESLHNLARDAADNVLGVVPNERILLPSPKRLPQLNERLRALAFRDGVSLIIVDELQTFTRSSTANALATSLLTQLLSLGVLCVWVANYGLGHRLLRRPQEDLDRLFGREPLIVLRDEPDSIDWLRTIEALLAIAPETFDVEASLHAEELHVMTAGLKRYLRLLLVESYRIARDRGSRVDIGCIRDAHRLRFGTKRRVIETLRQIDRGVTRDTQKKQGDRTYTS